MRAQGAGVQQQPGRVWQAQHPDLPGDGVSPSGDRHRAAEGRRCPPQRQSDRLVLRQDLALPPVQVCRHLSLQGRGVCVPGHTHRQTDSPRLGTQHVGVRRLSSGAINLVSVFGLSRKLLNLHYSSIERQCFHLSCNNMI